MTHNPRQSFLKTRSLKSLYLVTGAVAILYFSLIVLYFPIGNPYLYGILIIGQIFYLWQLLTFMFTVWDTNPQPPRESESTDPVDVFITVCGEPVEVIEETARAALKMTYPHKTIYLLNDGLVAGKDNWREPIALAQKLGIECITREIPGGAKAGNINHALTLTRAPLIAIFDADHVPHSDFLAKTCSYFADERMGFVQTPQYYKNHDETRVARSSWEQQELFFGPICKGKNRWNSASMCGTNMVVRRRALEEVGGMEEESIAEDFVTSVFIHERGWKSHYVPEVLAEGLAPHDLTSYYKQQFRWARGALDVIFRYNPLTRPGLTWAQKIQYLASASFYLSGTIIIAHASLPLLYLFFGLVPVQIENMTLAIFFLPYMFLTLFAIQASSNFSFTFHALAFSMAAFNVHISALVAAALRRKSAFVVTSKVGLGGSHLHNVYPHLAYIGLLALGIAVALLREGLSASVINNISWGIIHTTIFFTFIRAALPKKEAPANVADFSLKEYALAERA